MHTPAPATASAQARALAHFQDELSYIIECLVQDYTSEARHELSSLLDLVRASTDLGEPCRSLLADELETALAALRVDNRSSSARQALVSTRRRIYNTRRVAYGIAIKYPYERPYAATAAEEDTD